MSILSLLRNEFNKFNNTEVRKFDYIYYMTLNYCEIIIVYFWCLVIILRYIMNSAFGARKPDSVAC